MFEIKNITVPALDRAYRIFATLMGSPLPLGISDLSRYLGLGKSTVHGLVHSLLALGVLEQESSGGHKFRPSRDLMSLYKEALLKGSLARASAPLLESFSERHGVTALAGVFLQARVLVVEAHVAPGFSLSAYAGQMLPATAAALGKALLAVMTPDKARRLAPRMANGGPMNTEGFLAEVDQARVSGVAFDREEYLEGVRALACTVPPVKPLDPLGAVWMVGLAPSLTEERMAALAPELRVLAREVGLRQAGLEAAASREKGKRMKVLSVKRSDVLRATLADDCGNVGFLGIAPDGSGYHVVVPVDYQIARGVKAGLLPDDGTPFGGYHGWNYFECLPYSSDRPDARKEQTEINVRLLQAWAVGHGLELDWVD